MEDIDIIRELSMLREHEDHIEFKRAKHNYPFSGGSKSDIRERRRCVLGYVVALANEGGGRLALGMEDHFPHAVAGTDFATGQLGNLEDEIYERLGIRVSPQELFDEKGQRVVLLRIPSHPLGKALRFEGVPLMRVGESLREMDDAEYLKIISESDPDFSAKPCVGLDIEDLSDEAIEEMRKLLARKRSEEWLTKPLGQLLVDLDLMIDGHLNYAALILLGKPEYIKKYLPQCNIVVEYRSNHSMTRYTARKEFCGPLFTAINEVWDYLNQPASNPLQHIDNLPQIIDVPTFNKETIREAVINATIHRSLQMLGDVFIRQYPDMITITNPGGLPYGVNVGNILTVNSSPRSRRMAEVIEKTGLIERSGQGVDIMFANALSEGKEMPDYSETDDYQVCLNISGKVKYPNFFLFVKKYTETATEDTRLNVFDLLTLHYIMTRKVERCYQQSINRLMSFGLIKKDRYFGYALGNSYFSNLSFVRSGTFRPDDISELYNVISINGNAAMSDFTERFAPDRTIKQTRTFIQKCVEAGVLSVSGVGKFTRYQFGPELMQLEN